MHVQRRPLSPHLQIYRLPLTAVLSIMHRITGVLLALGTVVLVGWVVAIAAGGPWYMLAYHWFSSFTGQLLLIAWSGALYFHLCNGIRHLFWDTGMGFELRAVDISALLALAATTALTGLTWWLFYRIV